jgi:adenylate cyclase
MFLRRHYRVLTCTVSAMLAVIIAAIGQSPISLDGPLLDRLIEARAAAFPATEVPEQSPVAVIALDKRSLEEPELAVFPRVFFAPVWATILEGVFGAGARAVGFDLVFVYSANWFQHDYNRPFLEALGRNRERIVLARSATTLPAPPFLAALRHDEGTLGLTELVAEPDGRHRRVQATHETLRDGPLLGFASALLRRAKAPAMPPEVILAPRHHLEQIPTYAVIDVFLCAKYAPEELKQAFSGKIVLIGSTLPEEDRWVSSSRFLPPSQADSPLLYPCGLRRLGASNPAAGSVPGVFLHAAAVEAVITGHITSTAPLGLVAGLSGGMAAFGAGLGFYFAPWLTILVTALIAISLFVTAVLLLVADFWLPLALPLLALAATPVVAYVVRYLIEERMRRQIERAFNHYLSPMIVRRLASDPTTLKLGGERREVTIMFADLSGFTALSGKLDPEVLTRIVNQYLGYIVEQVEQTDGYVDKFIGDAVMALWGAPAPDSQHAVHGIRAAMATVGRINQARKDAPVLGEQGFSVKIGLNSGLAVVGNVGTEKRYNYTAVGETVNIAARLESVPSLYGCYIVVGPRTAELATAEFLWRELDTIQVKGREAPLAVFEPLAEEAKVNPDQRHRAKRYAEALAYYRAGQFAEAAEIWDVLASEESDTLNNQHKAGEPPSNPPLRMAERARCLKENPPAPPWDGIWVLSSK